MFSVIYYFKVKPGFDNQFIKSWNELTNYIIQYEGSLGSRLHKASNELYIAYAQWSNKKMWENSGAKLPLKANKVRQEMRSGCVEIKTIYELELIDDLLIDTRESI